MPSLVRLLRKRGPTPKKTPLVERREARFRKTEATRLAKRVSGGLRQAAHGA